MTEAFNQPPHKAAFRMSSPNPDGRPADEEEPMDDGAAAASADQQLPPGAVPKIRVNNGAAATSTSQPAHI